MTLRIGNIHRHIFNAHLGQNIQILFHFLTFFEGRGAVDYGLFFAVAEGNLNGCQLIFLGLVSAIGQLMIGLHDQANTVLIIDQQILGQ